MYYAVKVAILRKSLSEASDRADAREEKRWQCLVPDPAVPGFGDVSDAHKRAALIPARAIVDSPVCLVTREN